MREVRKKTDEELWKWVVDAAASEATGAACNFVDRRLNLRLRELSLRSQKALRESINAFSASSDNYSRKTVKLTWVLIALTIALLLLAIPPVIEITSKWFTATTLQLDAGGRARVESSCECSPSAKGRIITHFTANAGQASAEVAKRKSA
jgi:hypothetical protein